MERAIYSIERPLHSMSPAFHEPYILWRETYTHDTNPHTRQEPTQHKRPTFYAPCILSTEPYTLKSLHSMHPAFMREPYTLGGLHSMSPIFNREKPHSMTPTFYKDKCVFNEPYIP